jgi:hypothetical protein
MTTSMPRSEIASPPGRRPVTSQSAVSKTILLLCLLVMSSLVVDIFKLTRDNGWGDDFAAYIMQAQSITEGRMGEFVQRNTFTIENSSRNIGPITEPWGFPLLLAPAYAIFGLKILALKSVVAACFTLFLIAFFLLARLILDDTESLLITFVVAFNPTLLFGQSEVLSDIPFALFSTLSLFLISRWALQPDPRPVVIWQGVLIGLAIFMAVFVRWSGLTIFVALAAAQILHYCRGAGHGVRPYVAVVTAAVPYGVFGLLFLLQDRLFPSVYSLEPYPFSEASVQSVLSNLKPYFWLLADFFPNPVVDERVVYVALFLFFVVSLLARGTRDLPIHLYIAATLGLFILYPVYSGSHRLLYPIFPLFVLFSFDGMKFVAGRLKSVRQKQVLILSYAFWALVGAASFAASASSAWSNMAANRNTPGRYWGAFGPGSTAMFDFVRHHTPTDSVVIFQKPRAMRLRTDRDSFMAFKCEALPKADYVVTVTDSGGYDQIPPDQVETCNPTVALVPIYAKDVFIVYQIVRAP